jgi:hypothetical protein
MRLRPGHGDGLLLIHSPTRLVFMERVRIGSRSTLVTENEHEVGWRTLISSDTAVSFSSGNHGR